MSATNPQNLDLYIIYIPACTLAEKMKTYHLKGRENLDSRLTVSQTDSEYVAFVL